MLSIRYLEPLQVPQRNRPTAGAYGRINHTARLEEMDCHHCGACCRELIIEADWVDVAREPLIAEKCVRMDGHGVLAGDQVRWLLAWGETLPCPFLEADTCAIYPTRPNECVALKPGSEKCEMARNLAKEATDA